MIPKETLDVWLHFFQVGFQPYLNQIPQPKWDFGLNIFKHLNINAKGSSQRPLWC